jgi:thioester reductase-like protein
MRAYQLVTGATGLLGGYLLRDLTLREIPLAVVVRGSRIESARQRLEAIMGLGDEQVGRALARPVIFEGDLNKTHLGLSDSDRKWISRHCQSVIHNAASLTFVGEDRAGEPWRSNLGGTERVLELCREASIRRLHHVSTAYVCGLRSGRVLESELEMGQAFGNVYEDSKFQAEQLVHRADFLDVCTVFRPAIIVGDSVTGYTSTYHGFYAPLRVVASIISKVVNAGSGSEPLLESLGLGGEEGKNFVPVDWVSAVMARIIATPALHGRTYHLTPANRVQLTQMGKLMERVVGEHMLRLHDQGRIPQETPYDVDFLARYFREQMQVYQAYWRDDPVFDASNTASAVPDLPCPQLDEEVILRLCRYALEHNFGWPKAQPAVLEFDLGQHLRQKRRGEADASHSRRSIGLRVTGHGGGQWELVWDGQSLVDLEEGIAAPSGCIHLNMPVFQSLRKGESTVAKALAQGRILVEGSGLKTDEVQALLEHVAA